MICTECDEFLDEKTIWIARLSDGTVVYQDDNREGVEHHSAWIRLMSHCDDNDLGIEEIKVRFRDHTEFVPKGDRYPFSKAVGSFVGHGDEHFLIFGVVNDKKMDRLWYKIPEVIVTETETVEEEDLQKYESLMIKGS